MPKLPYYYQPTVFALERVGLVMHLLKYDHNVPDYLDADNMACRPCHREVAMPVL